MEPRLALYAQVINALDRAAAAYGLFVMGVLQDGDATVVLIGAGPGMWPLFKASSEFQDGAPSPLDRWSKAVLADLTQGLNASTVFPSDGPPYAPFIAWAAATGRFWQSPTGMLVHDTAGLMISIRGAVRIEGSVMPSSPVPSANPCEDCADRPCISACPVGALSGHAAYDVPGCKAFLETEAGADCMTSGCKARRACPVSQKFGRDPEQSAFHMRAFHPV